MTKDQLKFWSLVGVRTGVATAAIGWLMLILHWTGSRVVFTIGALLCIIAYTARTAWKEAKSATDWVKLLLVICIFTRAIVNTNHWPFPSWLWMTLGALTLASLVYIFFKDSSSLIPSSNHFIVSGVFFSLAACLIVIGVMFKIMHWPGAGMLLSLGTLSLVIWLVLEPFLPNSSKRISTENSFTTLDESLTEDASESAIVNKREKHSAFYFLAGGLMLVGLIMSLLGVSGADLVLLTGFIIGGVYLFITLKR